MCKTALGRSAHFQITISMWTPSRLTSHRIGSTFRACLAVVADGLVSSRLARAALGHIADTAYPGTDLLGDGCVFLNGLVVVVIGLATAGILQRLAGDARGTLLTARNSVERHAIAVRLLWGSVVVSAPAMSGSLWPHFRLRPWKAKHMIVGWTGMRGVVSIRRRVGRPLTLPEARRFPGRD